jgi:hypothetical protein
VRWLLSDALLNGGAAKTWALVYYIIEQMAEKEQLVEYGQQNSGKKTVYHILALPNLKSIV